MISVEDVDVTRSSPATIPSLSIMSSGYESNTAPPRSGLPYIPFRRPPLSFGFMVPVNYRKAIYKFKRGARRGRGRGERGARHRVSRNCEAVPYPQLHDGLHFKGLLIGNKVFLYDMVAYKFLRSHRGCFGELNCHRPYEAGVRRAPVSNYDAATDSFPPKDDISPIASLNLFEAYFLSLVGNCLEIWDGENGTQIAREDLVSVFTTIRPLFPYFFAAYYHFRMLNYVVTSGVKFGTDFVLYEYGPMKTHSVYMVYIVVPGLRDPSIAMVDTLQRIANAAKKDALLVRVTADDLSEENLQLFDCFTKMKITEIIVRRRERVFDKPILLPPAPVSPNFASPPLMTNYWPIFPPRSPFSTFGVAPPFCGRPATPLPPPFGGVQERIGRPPRPGAFQFPTVHLGVRRTFRGRSFCGGTQRNDIAPRLSGWQPHAQPVFRSLNSWGFRGNRLGTNRPGFTNRGTNRGIFLPHYR